MRVVMIFPSQQVTFNKECKGIEEGLGLVKLFLAQVRFDISDVVIFFRKE